MRRLLFALALTLSAGFAAAGPVDDARLEYIAGNYEKALEVLMPAAAQGDANAQNIVGVSYDEGNGVEQDHARALEWYGKSAAQEFSRALFNLGEFWLHGRPGFAPDYPRAIDLFQRAAKQDNAGAIGNLGFMYEMGHGVEADPAVAAELYERASGLGATFATGNLASLYAKGKGVPQDYARAYELLTKAAAEGHAPAFTNLGVMYEQGYHVPANILAAYAFYREATALGDARAANHLASLLLLDGYFWTDRVDAFAHCLWSRANALSDAVLQDFSVDCDVLAATLSEEERADAENRLKDF